eukprot:TRINITY_DN12397_c0_g1_i1.p2 TRINITY_DN12397_c0_g1~~TRINITY_DN12397_c0_g1_i1.p2  ORF type:complete len:156 (-),score=29.31 TRINITY_DN12397_c0_g1_i1:49-516(-)
MWEAVLTLRRLLLAMLIAVIPFTAIPLTVMLIVFVLLLSVLIQHSAMPFNSRLENRLELLSLYVLLGSYVAAFTAQASANQPYALTWVPVVLVVVNCITASILVIFLLLVFVTIGLRRVGGLVKFLLNNSAPNCKLPVRRCMRVCLSLTRMLLCP